MGFTLFLAGPSANTASAASSGSHSLRLQEEEGWGQVWSRSRRRRRRRSGDRQARWPPQRITIRTLINIIIAEPVGCLFYAVPRPHQGSWRSRTSGGTADKLSREQQRLFSSSYCLFGINHLLGVGSLGFAFHFSFKRELVAVAETRKSNSNS